MFNRNNVKTVNAYIPSIASAGSLIGGIFMAPAACEVVGLKVITGGATLSTNWNINIYKNASNASSRIGTTGSLATLGSYTGTNLGTYLNGTNALQKLAAGDIVLFEWTSGGGTTTNSVLELEYVYGYQD